MIARTAENAQNSQRISEESADAVKEGQGLIQSMVSAINEIDMSNAKVAEEIENSNREIRDIVKVISEIGAKTQVINDIVFQTKLLSFNASVEAARAGEHGKGFAVVAEEVGNLARMSGNAAKEITEMLEGSISKVEGIVTNTTTRVNGLVKTGKSKVEIGIEIAEKCDHTFQEIVMKSTRVSSLVAEISSATQEQAVGVNEVSKAITQLNEATQQSNTVSEASAASAERLNSQSLEMAEVVAELVVIVKGGNANEKSIPDLGTREGETPSAQKNSDYLKAA
ncbi:MAG: hypothetical protein H7301_03170 [Cryobacterium sp.]|nr:hypothetical protein [Oligoflexia bacterium]